MLSEHDRRAYEQNIWKAYIFQFLHAFQLWWPIWVIYLTDERGFSLTQVSGLEALFWLVIVVAEVPTGIVADRFGRKPSLMASAVFTSLALLVFGLATNYPIVLLSYVAWGVGLTFQSGADAALTFESLKALGRERDYQRVAGIGWGLFSLGVVGGLLLGAPLAAATNLSFPILISAAITFSSLLVAATFKEPDLPQGEERLPYRSLMTASARTAWRTPSVRAMLVLAALLLAAPNAAVVFAQPFLDQHHVPVAMFGVAQAPTRAAGMIASLVAYRVSGAFGFRWTFIGAFVLLGGAYALLGGWDSVYAFAGIGVAIIMLSMLLPVVVDYLNQRIPNNQRATILSYRQLLTSIAIATILPLQGLISDHFSLRTMFLLTAGFVTVTIPFALLYWWRADAEDGESRRAAADEAQPTVAG
jgi:MFS family permease